MKPQDLNISYQVTEAGARTTKVIFYNPVTEDYCQDKQPIQVKCAQLAKYFNQGRVKRALNGIPVVEV